MNFIVYLVSINIISFIMIFIDKRKAIYHKWRISERILLFIAFICGCFGMIIGMKLFHHKTNKLKFKLVYLFCLIWIVLIMVYRDLLIG